MNRRNKKYRILFDTFDNIDGKQPNGGSQAAAYEQTPSTTPRFNQSGGTRNVKTPSKLTTANSNKTPRSLSIDRKTPLSMADESEYNPDNTCMFCNEVRP